MVRIDCSLDDTFGVCDQFGMPSNPSLYFIKNAKYFHFIDTVDFKAIVQSPDEMYERIADSMLEIPDRLTLEEKIKVAVVSAAVVLGIIILFPLIILIMQFVSKDDKDG